MKFELAKRCEIEIDNRLAVKKRATRSKQKDKLTNSSWCDETQDNRSSSKFTWSKEDATKVVTLNLNTRTVSRQCNEWDGNQLFAMLKGSLAVFSIWRSTRDRPHHLAYAQLVLSFWIFKKFSIRLLQSASGLSVCVCGKRVLRVLSQHTVLTVQCIYALRSMHWDLREESLSVGLTQSHWTTLTVKNCCCFCCRFRW